MKLLIYRNIYETLTAYAVEYIMVIIVTIFSVGYRGKTVDMEQHSERHRTSISRFLRNKDWEDSGMERAMKALVIKTIYEESERSGKPVYCIVDDTIASKTKPSSQANHPIESAYFHYSHLKRKQDYGHQIVGVLLSCNGITLPYGMILYDKTVSKIDIAANIAEELPTAPNPSYLLCDSWYVCETVLDAFLGKGFLYDWRFENQSHSVSIRRQTQRPCICPEAGSSAVQGAFSHRDRERQSVPGLPLRG